MGKEHLELRFQGPFTLTGNASGNVFRQREVRQAGIYLFAMETDQAGTVVRYVGETGVSFQKRLKEHLIQTLGGNYRVSDVASLRSLQEIVLWDGMWRRGTTGRMQEFVDRYVQLAPAIKEYLDAYRIFLAPMPSEIGQRQRRLVESALARHFQQGPHLMAPDIRYLKRTTEDPYCTVMAQSSSTVTGLPCVVTA
ncbi:hypothetical protein ACFQDE_17650 [Deinococcus caeni]|uniref:GIY-YIG domain-containing protein n=1 Tax=Deinococcus caeni TaxID=569127 RepID=A0ABP9U980_9DEIO